MKTYKKIILSVVLGIFALSSVLAFGAKDVTASVEQNSYPTRIVSLGASATEILFAVGAGEQVVARTDFCNFPPEASSIPSLGGFDGKTFSLESIIAYKPDFVVLFAGMHDHLIEPLQRYEIQYFLSDATSIDKVLAEIAEIGKITGHEENALALVEEIQSSIENLSLISNKTVYWEVWNAPYMTIGGTSFINELISKAGGKNIFADVEQSYPAVNEESIIARNPDVIFIPSDSPVTAEDVKNRAGWQDISAVKNNRIFKIDADITSRSGPRIKEAILLINDFLAK
jgi:iron complex transport system substrate-binding protein